MFGFRVGGAGIFGSDEAIGEVSGVVEVLDGDGGEGERGWETDSGSGAAREASRPLTIEERIERLAAQNQAWRLSTMAVLTLCGVLASAGSSPLWGTLEARELVLVDEEGRERLLVRLDDAGSPTLRLLDDRGIDRARLTARERENCELQMYDAVGLRVQLDTTSRLHVLDRGGYARAGVYLSDRDSGLLLDAGEPVEEGSGSGSRLGTVTGSALKARGGDLDGLRGELARALTGSADG